MIAHEVRLLKPGMNAECRIIVEDRKEPVLQIPIQAVISTPVTTLPSSPQAVKLNAVNSRLAMRMTSTWKFWTAWLRVSPW